ncbi:MAG: penicillin-binding protein 2 [Patescibacteria group bacterium]|nr:penicillin-binding protein 2 [Patescibacteria group bacterium]
MAFRLISLALFFTLLFSALGLKLYKLQIEKSAEYIERAHAQQEILKELEFRRGQFFFTDKNNANISVAFNKDYPVIYASPEDIEDVEFFAEKVSSALGLDRVKLAEDIKKSVSKRFKPIVEKATDEQVNRIRDLKIKGIYDNVKQYRFYPSYELGAHVLGFVGVNEYYSEPTGLYGAEKYFSEDLVSGKDIKLTIDRVIQARAEQVIDELVKKFEAVGGTVIVQDPKTGKILAMVSKPSFDPNNYNNFPLGSFQNPAVQYVYEPGSVFKPLTMAAGIDTGAFTTSTTFIDTGSVTLNGKTIKNWDNKAHGKVTMTNVIERSINTGAVFAEQKIGNSKFLEYLKKFGFGEKTNIDLPDEVYGSLKNIERKEVRAIDFATASYGQGTSVTPVQLITAFSSLANGGLLMRPFINSELKPYVVRRVIEEKTASQVVGMMEFAVEKAGVATIPGFRIVGKTGTAFVPDFVKGGYSEEFIHSYVGFAPVTDPKFVILIKLDKPKAELAGMTVVPAFKDLAQYILNYLNAAPDKLEINDNKK